MLKVVLTFFFFVILTELAIHTVLLLGQLVFYTYTLFGTLKIHYECGTSGYSVGLRIRRSWVQPPSPATIFSSPEPKAHNVSL